MLPDATAFSSLLGESTFRAAALLGTPDRVICELVLRRARTVYGSVALEGVRPLVRPPHDLDLIVLDGAPGDALRIGEGAWYEALRISGTIAATSGADEAARFFGRIGWSIATRGDAWSMRKAALPVTYFMPAYNCADTIVEAIDSIVRQPRVDGDEILVTDDGSSDGTRDVLRTLARRVPFLRVIEHRRNRGGAAARNSAIEQASNPLLFCLDSDNVLPVGTIARLKTCLVTRGVDAAAVREVHYFESSTAFVMRRWIYPSGAITLADQLATPVVPASSGNYLFTLDSWERAGGYPEFADALDTWGFGFRQAATGSRMETQPGTHYCHRVGHHSYFQRFDATQQGSIIALQIVLPFLELLEDDDADYITSRAGRNVWFEQIASRPIRVKDTAASASGVILVDRAATLRRFVRRFLRAWR